MKNIVNSLMTVLVVGMLAAGCSKQFEDFTVNTNKPTSVPASLLFNGILNDMVDDHYTMAERWGQYFLCNYDYYGNNRYDFGSGDNYFTSLKNVGKMEEEAIKNGADAVNPYSALGKFFRAYFFTKMSLQMGDLPLSEALQGANVLKPKYDDQKSIFLQSLKWLDTANTQLSQLITSNNNTLAGDIFYNNSLSKWQKAVNSFQLRLLIELSKKESDVDLGVKTRFAAIVGNAAQYPIMQSAGDNLEYVHVTPTNFYPMNPSNFGFDALRYNTSATYIGLLTALNDPRVFVTAEPAAEKIAGGTPATSFAAFVGADPGEDLGAMYAEANAGKYSLINRNRYYQTYTGEAAIQIGYPEMLLNIAEAINRGWISAGPLGTAEDHYKAAIKASMDFYGIPASGSFPVYFLKSGSPGSTAVYNTYTVGFDFDSYYAQNSVKYAGGAVGLTQILQQRYLALFRHSGLEAYYQNRRTGVPVFSTGPGTGNGERIAKRFQYFNSEQTSNADNYKSALTSQYSGNDDINGEMWLIK